MPESGSVSSLPQKIFPRGNYGKYGGSAKETVCREGAKSLFANIRALDRLNLATEHTRPFAVHTQQFFTFFLLFYFTLSVNTPAFVLLNNGNNNAQKSRDFARARNSIPQGVISEQIRVFGLSKQRKMPSTLF